MHSIRLSDGSLVDVGDKTAWGVQQLLQAIDRLATSDTQTFVLVEVRQGAKPLKLVFTNDGERLAELGDALSDLSGRIHRLGAVWEGNAPQPNRSGSRH
jgi:hypothetical protein